VLFSYLLAHDAQEEVLPSGSDHGAPAVAEPTWARHLGLTLSPAYCFRVAVIPAIVCVLLAMSIPDPREILRMHGVGKAGAIVSKEESEVSCQHDTTLSRHHTTRHDTTRPHHTTRHTTRHTRPDQARPHENTPHHITPHHATSIHV